MKSIKKDTPLYMLDAFNRKAKDSAFYIERFNLHLEKHKFVNKPHSHDFYLLMYITEESGDHTIACQ